MTWYKPQRIIIDPVSLKDQISQRVLTIFQDVEPIVMEDIHSVLGTTEFGKGTLILTRNRGRFVKDFPSQEEGCGEKYITPVINCPFNCSYCYLRSYFNYRSIVIFTNVDDLVKEVEQTIRSNSKVILTSGEFSDSLALEHLTDSIRTLLPLFDKSESILEIRTKTALAEIVTGLFDGRSTGNGVENSSHVSVEPWGVPLSDNLKKNLRVTWTLSPSETIINEEPGTATLPERIEALAKTASAGIRTGIRLDPVIPFYFNESDYSKLLQKLSTSVPHEMIDMVEIGILRFPGRLMSILGRENNASNILKGDFIKGKDGRYVLIRPCRMKIYRTLVSTVKKYLPGVRITVSMEHPEVIEELALSIN